jgi:hypothetical protein
MPAVEASRLIDATILPPARQGDVYRAIKRYKPAVVGIVDGYFHQSASIWHREILWAMTQGIHVLGAASMGALRAAELHTFGMRGVGRIFEAYRVGRFAPYEDSFEDDDEVAVIHGPPETGFVLLSEAMVDIRATLARADEAGVISDETRGHLIALGKAMPYRVRNLARIIARAVVEGGRSQELAALTNWLPDHQASLKQEDAAAMLAEIERLLADYPGPFAPAFRLEQASVWMRFLEREGLARAGSDPERAVMDELRWQPAARRQALRHAVLRRAAIAQAAAAGTEPSPRELRASLDTLRHAFGLMTHEALQAWATDNGLDEEGLGRLVREEALLNLLEGQDDGTLASAAADHLRLSGRFAELVARSEAKRRFVATAGIAGRRPAGAALADLIDLFVSERLGREVNVPSSPEALAARLGASDLDVFVEELYLEWMYSRWETAEKAKPEL